MARHITDSGFKNWTPDRLPDLTGKTYVITGGNSGIGLEAARMLGKAGGDVVLACRSPEKAQSAKAALDGKVKGDVSVVALDLSDLGSVRAAAGELRGRLSRIDALINNAGIMQTPPMKTKDGFELQLGTNHIGHFVWTSLLIGLVEAAEGRVVMVCSIAHKFGRIHFDDLMVEKAYTPTKAYGQSKLANLLFAFELDRRLEAAGAKTIAIACHPGYSATALQSTGPTGFLNVLYKALNPLLAQGADAGAIPTVLAAAGTEARRGAYYGPQKMSEARGPVGDALVADHAQDRAAWARLWEATEALLGEPFAMPGRAPQAKSI